MNDRAWSVIAMLGFVLVGYVIYANVRVNYIDKTFVADGYYSIPESEKEVNESGIYASVKGIGKGLTCPATSQSKPDDLIKFSKASSGYSYNFWITPASSYNNKEGIGNGGVFTDASWSKICELLELNAIKNKAEFYFSDFGCNEDGKQYKIIAPFNYHFNNCNISDDDSIVITYSSNTFKIVFENVSNWFCAGDPGNIESTEWLNHGSQDYPHEGIYGNSANSDIVDGIAGDCIGYANKDTKVYLEHLSNGVWSPITVEQWLSNNT